MSLAMSQTPSDAPTFMLHPRKPKLSLPLGACDAHVHVFGPGKHFPYAPRQGATPADAPKERLFALHDFLGISRCLIVHTAAHGTDNSVTADALAAKGGSYRGVALLRTDVSDAELKRLDAAGFRGARFHYMPHLEQAATIDEAIAFGARLADLGRHLQIHMAPELIAELAPAIHRAPVPVVIDHMGRVDASLGLDQPAFRALLHLLRDRNVCVKVSGADRISRQGPPYADAVPFARTLAQHAPERVVWGTDWPHPNMKKEAPDDGVLVDYIPKVAAMAAAQRALLVDNPMRLYWPEQS